MSEAAIRVSGLGKRYRIGSAGKRITKAREAVLHLAMAPVRNFTRVRRLSSFPDGGSADVIWALRDVSFDVAEGEVLGIVGPNGAGKSTLLKILSRITVPTAGRAELRGRVGSLLEVGTGFHPELTGRDNVYLNGAMLGMDKRYIDRRFDDIVAFAGVGRFIDTPVKRYSSGMHVRLAFAVAAHLEPEVLIVDEVLAVGDTEFQRRCLGKMSEVSGEGRTVLFVSHNLVAVQGLCDRAIWLRGGRIQMDGGAQAVVSEYLKKTLASMSRFAWYEDGPIDDSGDEPRLSWARVRPEGGEPGDLIDVHTSFLVEIGCRTPRAGSEVRPRIHVVNQDRVTVFKSNPGIPHRNSVAGREEIWGCRIPGDLLNDGQYTLNVRLIRQDGSIACVMDDLLSFEVADTPAFRDGSFGEWGGVVRPRLEWWCASDVACHDGTRGATPQYLPRWAGKSMRGGM